MDDAVAMVSHLSFLLPVLLWHQYSPLPHPLLHSWAHSMALRPGAGIQYLHPFLADSLGCMGVCQVEATLERAVPDRPSRPLAFLWVPSDLQQALGTDGCGKRCLAGQCGRHGGPCVQRKALGEPERKARVAPQLAPMWGSTLREGKKFFFK